MVVQWIGENLLVRDAGGRFKIRIATVFPRQRVIVTVPGIHATQRLAYLDFFNQQRVAAGLPELDDCQIDDLCVAAVDLVLEDDRILIRPDPADMELAFAADELLQEIAPKEKIKYLHVREERVREAIKRRGECWRINALPHSKQEMGQMIQSSRIGIENTPIYYYNNTTGTRFLTCQGFGNLALLPDAELGKHLLEIRDHIERFNRFGSPEIELFGAEKLFLRDALAANDLAAMDGARLRALHAEIAGKFRCAVGPEYRRDDPDSPQWRGRMYAVLIGQSDAAISEESLLGLSAEFFMQIEWLPGGRIEEGELIFDPIFEDGANVKCSDNQPLCDEKARGFIFNFIRDYGDIEYINIGRVAGSLSSRRSTGGRRGVYLAEIKERGIAAPILRIIRMQKWGVREHLDEGKDLLNSLLESEQYTQYILDRRLGCRQLGMNLPARVTSRNVTERYSGSNARYVGIQIHSTYFERDYISGLATDKVPVARMAEGKFAEVLAGLLGRAAAPNLIVGRCDVTGDIIFDDGDELLVEGPGNLPVDILVADPTGTFGNYRGDLGELAVQHGSCLIRHRPDLPDVENFIRLFIDAFVERFLQIQQEYRKRKRAFDTLFRHQRRDEGGSFAYRWERVLSRLESTDPHALAQRIRQGAQSTM